MKDMIYGDVDALIDGYKLLASGTYDGIAYAVINNNGAHPCAYIEVTGTQYDESTEFNRLPLEERQTYWKCDRQKRNAAYSSSMSDVVHGGLTYSGHQFYGVYEPDFDCNCTRWFVGWDYGHYGDEIWFKSNRIHAGKKWTTEEIVEECKACIIALKCEINNNKGN